MLSVVPKRSTDAYGGHDLTLNGESGWAHGFYCSQGRRPYVSFIEILHFCTDIERVEEVRAKNMHKNCPSVARDRLTGKVFLYRTVLS
jgi:hypothetical protein